MAYQKGSDAYKKTYKTAAQLRKEEEEKKKKEEEAKKAAEQKRNELRVAQGLKPSTNISKPATTPSAKKAQGEGSFTPADTAQKKLVNSINKYSDVKYTPKGKTANEKARADLVNRINSPVEQQTVSKKERIKERQIEERTLTPIVGGSKKHESSSGAVHGGSGVWNKDNKKTRFKDKQVDEKTKKPVVMLPVGNKDLSGDDWTSKTEAIGDNDVVYNMDGKRFTLDDLRKQGYSEDLIQRFKAYMESKYGIGKENKKQYQIEGKTPTVSEEKFYELREDKANDLYQKNEADRKAIEKRITANDFTSEEEKSSAVKRYNELLTRHYADLMSQPNNRALADEIKATEKALAEAEKNQKREATRTGAQARADLYGGTTTGKTGAEYRAERAPGWNNTIETSSVAVLTNKLNTLRQLYNTKQAQQNVGVIKAKGDEQAFEEWYSLNTELGTAKKAAVNAEAREGMPAYDTTSAQREFDLQNKVNAAEAALRAKGYTDADFQAWDNYKDYEAAQKASLPYQHYIKKHPVLGPAAAAAVQVVSSPVRGLARISDLLNGDAGYSPGKEFSNIVKGGTETSAQMIQEAYPNWFGKVGSTLYQWSVSAAESAFNVATTGNLATVFMGLNAAADSYDDALAKGLTKEQAVGLGITAGIFEALFEYLSLEKIKVFSSTKLKGWKGFLSMYAKSGFTEGMEEVSTDIANLCADYLMAGGMSEYNQAMAQGYTPTQYAMKVVGDLAMSFLGGAFGGLALGGVTSIQQQGMYGINPVINDIAAGREINATGDVTQVIEAAKNSQDKRTQKLGAKLEGKVQQGKSATRLTGQVYNRVQGESLAEAAENAYRQKAKERGIEIDEREVKAIGRAADQMLHTRNRNGAYVLDPAAEEAIKEGIGKEVIDELFGSKQTAEWAEQTRKKYNDFARSTGAYDDAEGRRQIHDRSVAARAADVTKAVRGENSYTLVENGSEGQYGGEEGASVNLGGMTELDDQGRMMLVTDYQKGSDVQATAPFSTGGEAGTVHSNDAEYDALLTDVQEHLNGRETGGYGTAYQSNNPVTMSTAAANTAIAQYSPRVNPDAKAYSAWFWDAYKAGKRGMSWDMYLNLYNQRGAGEWTEHITPAQLQEAFRVGAMEINPGVGVTRIGTMQLTKKMRGFLDLIDFVARKLKFSVIAVDDIAGKNGYVSNRADVAVISLSAEGGIVMEDENGNVVKEGGKATYEGRIMTAAFHEIYHIVKRELGEKAGRSFVNAVLKEYKAAVGEKQYLQDFAKKKADYDAEIRGLDDYDAAWLLKEEMAASYFGNLAEENIEGLINRLNDEGGKQLLDKVMEILNKIRDALKEAFNQLAGRDPAAAAAQKTDADAAMRVIDLFLEKANETAEERERRLARQGETISKQAEDVNFGQIENAERMEFVGGGGEITASKKSKYAPGNSVYSKALTGGEWAKYNYAMISGVDEGLRINDHSILVEGENSEYQYKLVIYDNESQDKNIIAVYGMYGTRMDRDTLKTVGKFLTNLEDKKYADEKVLRGLLRSYAKTSGYVFGKFSTKSMRFVRFGNGQRQYLSDGSEYRRPESDGGGTAGEDRNTTKTNNTEQLTEQTTFSLKSTVEETRDLVAVHNMTADQLQRSLDLGGLPMPSIAILKAQSGHARYGDVSLVFDKSTIDPQESSKNKVYGGDAWTPVYPTVEFKVNKANQDKISAKYYELGRKYGYDAARALYYYTNEAERALNNAKSESALLEKLYDDTGLMQLYRLDKGLEQIQPVQIEKRETISPEQIEQYDYIIATYDAQELAALRELREKTPLRFPAWAREHADELEGLHQRMYRDLYGFSEEEAKNVTDNKTTADFAKTMRGLLQYLKNGRETVRTETDTGATEDKIRSETDQADYRAWIDGMFKGIAEKSGIRNNRDYFDRMGNQRSWEALHYENNLENVVRVMSEGIQKGGTGLFSGNSIWGVATKDYNSIAEIKKDSSRLGTMQEEEYAEIKKAFGDRFTEIAKPIVDSRESNPFIALDTAFENLIDAVRTNKTKAGMLRFLRQYSPQATEKTVDDMVALVKDISEMPTEYFEAKPMRAVGLDEIRNVILPDTAPAELTDALAEMEIPYETYPAGDEDARKAALNRREDLLFSKKTDADYMAAVERGDVDEAQRMVDEAAKEAGYDTPKLYHGSGAFGFTEFDLDKGEHAIFATSNMDVAKTYVGETDRMLLSERATENIDNLRGEKLLARAKKQFPGEYDNYYLVSEREKRDDADIARNKVRGIAEKAAALKEDFNGAFNEEKEKLFDSIVEAIGQIAEAQDDDALFAAKEQYESLIWDFKWMDESLQLDLSNMIGQQINLLVRDLDTALYQGDLYRDGSKAINEKTVFDNQLALELEADIHKGVYQLYGKTGRVLDFDAKGANWNDIRDWIPTVTKGDTRVRPSGGYYELVEKRTGNILASVDRTDAIKTWSTGKIHDFLLFKANEKQRVMTEGPKTTRFVSNYAFNHGYDSVVIRNLRDVSSATDYRGTGDIYIFNAKNAVKSADPVTYDDDGNVIPLSERFNAEKEDIRWSKKTTDARRELDEATAGNEVLGQMIDTTLALLKKAHTELDKAEYDAWLQGEKTEGRVKTRKGVMGVVKKYNDPALTGISNEELTDRIMDSFMNLKDYDFGADELVYTILDVMANKAAAQSETVENETRDIIRSITNGMKYVISDAEFNELVTMAGGRRALNDVYRKVYGFTLVPQSEAQRRGATVAFDSGMQEVEEELPGLFGNVKNYFGFDAGNGSAVNMAAALYEMQDAMQMQERTLEEELRLDQLDPNSDEALEATQTLYEIAYQEAANFAEDLIRLTPVRTLADTYTGQMNELRQAAKGQLQARQKEIARLREQIETAETGLNLAANVSATMTAEAAKMQRRLDSLQDQLKLAERDLDRAQTAGDAKRAELEQKVAKLTDQIAGLKDELKKEQEKVTRRDAALDKARADRDQKIADQKLADDIYYGKKLNEKNKQLEAQKRYYQDMRHRQAEQRKDTAAKQRIRKRIRNNVRWLNDRITSPTDGKFIPADMRDTVAEIVKTFLLEDTTMKGNGSIFTADQILRLNAFYSKLRSDESSEGLVDDEAQEIIAKMSDPDSELYLVGRRLSDLSQQGLRAIDNVLSNMVLAVRNYNKLFGDSRRDTLSVYGDRTISQVDSKEPDGKLAELRQQFRSGKINMNMLKPIYLFKSYVGGEIGKLFDDVREAQNVWAFRVRDSHSFFEKAKEKYNYKNWKKEEHTFTLSNGTIITLTKDAVLQIYATWEREQQSLTRTNHLLGGGVVLAKDLQKKQTKRNLSDEQKEALRKETAELADKKAHTLTAEDLQTILNTLTQEQKNYADTIVAYLTRVVSVWGNEASRELSGYDKFTEGYYFPYQSSDLYLHDSMGVTSDVRLKNAGYTKALTANASNPIVLTGFSEVAAKHVGNMASYSSLAVPLENLHRLINYKNRDNGTSVKASLTNSYGDEINAYIKRFLDQMNGGVKSDGVSTISDRMMSRFKRSAVALNPSVIIQQPSAIARAMAMINPIYFHGTVRFSDYREMLDHCGTAVIKSFGGWDIQTGKSTTDYILGERTALDRWGEFTGKFAEFADNATWTNIWNAVKRETAHEMDVKLSRKGMSEEFYARAAARFNEIIDYTQVYDSTLSRSQWMRSDNGINKMLTAFMAEPTTSYNLLLYSGMKSKGATINKGRAIGALVANVILNTALQSLVGAWRDKDKKNYWERWFKKFIQGVFGTRENLHLDSELDPLNMIPFVKDIISAFEGYDVERSDMQLISGVIQKFSKLRKKYQDRDDDEALWEFMTENSEQMIEFVVELANLSPIPAKTIYRDFIKGTANAVESKKNGGYKLVGQHFADIWRQNFEGEWDKNQILYNAVINKDDTVLTEYLNVTDEDIAKYTDEANDEFTAKAHAQRAKSDAFHTKVQTALQEIDTRVEQAAKALLDYDFTSAEKLRDAIVADGFDINDANGAITKMRDKLEPPETWEEKEKKDIFLADYEMLKDAYDMGSKVKADKTREELHRQGKTDKDINSEIQKPINEDFTTGEITLAEARQAYKDYTTYTDEEIDKKLTDKVAERYDNGDMSYDDVKKMYSELGIAEDKISEKLGKLVASDYENGKISSKEAAVAEYIKQTGETDEQTAQMKFDYADLKAQDENYPLEYSQYKGYVSSGLGNVGVDADVYAKFLEETKGIDSNTTSEGWLAYQYRTRNVKKTKKYTQKQWHYVDAIDRTFATADQKDAAYAAIAAKENWKMTKLQYAPWH